MSRVGAAIDPGPDVQAAPGATALRLAGGVLLGVALGLLTLGSSGAASHEQQAPIADPEPVAPVATAAPAVEQVAPADAPLRIRGRVGDGLYGSLLAVGVSPAEASEFLAIVARRLNLARDVGPDDNFDLVLAPSAAGARALLYAALQRPGASDVEMMRWSVDGKFDWLDAGSPQRGPAAAVRPVAGRVTSAYGLRVHPILNFTRLHKGIDYAAGSGAPIAATASGIVSRAGWAGGYGRQVRIDHGGGMSTSYSHMSGFAVAPGTRVGAGQVIGYVGSSGLSTGPHLHYEVYRGGVAVNPGTFRFGRSAPLLSGRELARFEAQHGQILHLAIQPAGRS